MKIPERKRRDLTASMLLLVLALGLFASPFTESWSGFRPPWYVPYLLWLGLIGATALLAGSPGDDDD